MGEGENRVFAGKVPPAADILFGPAQPRAEKGASKLRKNKGLPSRGKSVFVDNEVPTAAVPSPVKVLQSGGTGRGLLKVANEASRSCPVHTGVAVPRSSEDEGRHDDHGQGKTKKRRRRVHFASDSEVRAVDPPADAPPLPTVSLSRILEAFPAPITTTEDASTAHARPSPTVYGFKVERRAKLDTRSAKDLKLHAKVPSHDS